MDILLKKINCEEYDAWESTIDTQYFGIPSAKVVLKQPCNAETAQLELLDFLRDYEFSMILNKTSHPVNNRWLGEKTSAFLVDINVQLRKELTLSRTANIYAPSEHEVSVSNCVAENKEIVHIAETYFQHSQFLNDPYLPEEKARCIYGDIVKNAFGKPERFFVISKVEDMVAGFLLFSMNVPEASSTVQLIAVNQNYKRQGIGNKLIHSLESYIITRGISCVNVGTQLTNLGALKFYNNNGFTQCECNSIYHYWPQKK